MNFQRRENKIDKIKMRERQTEIQKIKKSPSPPPFPRKKVKKKKEKEKEDNHKIIPIKNMMKSVISSSTNKRNKIQIRLACTSVK